MAEVDERIKTYAEVTRETQVALREEQEAEMAARRSRSLNLRISGLEETSGEDTEQVVKDFLTEVLQVVSPTFEKAFRVGKSDRGPWAVLIRFGSMETKGEVIGNRSKLKGKKIWIDADLTLVQMEERRREIQKVKTAQENGYVAYMRDGRAVVTRVQRGRGFGGIGVWVRDGIGVEVKVEKKDVRNQYVCVRLNQKDLGSNPLFIVAAYYAPWGAPVYQKMTEGGNPMQDMAPTIVSCNDLGSVCVVGDFNSRVSSWQRNWTPSEGAPLWITEGEVQEVRFSEDEVKNTMAEFFMEVVDTCGLTVLNGVNLFLGTGEFTCVTAQGSSVVDYLLCSDKARGRITHFGLCPLAPESDHRAIRFTLSGVVTKRRSQRSRGTRGDMDYSKKEEFALRLAAELPQDSVTTEEFIRGLQVVSRVALSKRERDRPWFDEECHAARVRAMNSSHETKLENFREYKGLIRSKKRAFIRRWQQQLCAELRSDPRSFWRRVRPRQIVSSLAETDLLQYVKELYFIQGVDRMPKEDGPICTFGPQEIEGELQKLRGGAAADLEGLTVEMLKCGGETARVENEYHTLLVCPQYSDIRAAHNIDIPDLHVLYQIDAMCLGRYILAVVKRRLEVLETRGLTHQPATVPGGTLIEGADT
ncbi:hypothetical protein R1sor_027173 [Riccia sorocarpa]|uniref:Endonuclease/exonuclease/phosphatase domain-containing protein n=1 Tax=Riccia sorocarpa TaxID=122646 RepID=A0ABD3GGL9_9MARC